MSREEKIKYIRGWLEGASDKWINSIYNFIKNIKAK